MIKLVSVSGGKDSTATLLLALERHPRSAIRAVFADTGNEHELTLSYIDYLQASLTIEIVTLRQDFTAWWWRRRDYIRDHWPAKGVPDDAVSRALDLFARGPTGNPYLDLCCIKGRFPSRTQQFCTQFLKTMPLDEHALQLVERHGAVQSWQGVRAEESSRRAAAPVHEYRGEGLYVYRPIKHWTIERVFAQHAKHGIEPNPLYRLGMARVGCMPCINASKDELRAIARRFPEHIDRIAEWERLVSAASKRGQSGFIPAPDDGHGALVGRDIRSAIEWSKTSRGGRQYDWMRVDDDAPACASVYGLCE